MTMSTYTEAFTGGEAMNNSLCLITGCDEDVLRPNRICPMHWFRLPITLRRRWWKETDYGRKTPSDELVAALSAAQ